MRTAIARVISVLPPIVRLLNGEEWHVHVSLGTERLNDWVEVVVGTCTSTPDRRYCEVTEIIKEARP